MDSEMTGRTADLIVCAALGDPMSTSRYEGLCAGNANTRVLGVMVCYAPTLDLLRRAAAEKKNFIVSREHPFFLHGGLYYSYGTDGLEAAMKDDPVVAAKRRIINANQLMVYRYASAWDLFKPKAQSLALAGALGLKPLPSAPTDRSRGVVCDVPRTTLAALAQTAADRVKAFCPRTVGDAASSVTRVAVLAGETDPTPALARLLADPKIDGVIVGGGGTVDEVDGAIAWFQDLMATGRKIAMLAIGHLPSEAPGCAEMAKFLRGVFPALPVEYWETPDPGWIPRS
jgi:putative NIF3 family GTP cyclohydrolase 1 type 2